jgi:hypothetical protein
LGKYDPEKDGETKMKGEETKYIEKVEHSQRTAFPTYYLPP